MIRPFIALLALALPPTMLSGQPMDAKAVEIAQTLTDAMGGREALTNARYLQFSFLVVADGQYRARRHHFWDTWQGRYRLESRPVRGQTEFVLFNVNTQQGDVYVDGNKIEGEEAETALTAAYRSFINDTYWLMMPWKWLDPGVKLSYIGSEEYRGEVCDVVELTFQGVGLTPGDIYRGYVSRQSGFMVRWTYTVESGSTGDWDWEYTETGGIKLASNHKSPDGREIRMGTVVASTDLATDAFFTDPTYELVRKR